MGEQVTAAPGVTEYHHLGLTVRDVDRSEAWYAEVSGFQQAFVDRQLPDRARRTLARVLDRRSRRTDMQIGWGSIRRAAIAGVVLIGVVGAVQASPVAAEDGGYSAAARACQEGYSSLVGVQDGQVTTFDTPGACVAYAAGGGQLVTASVVQPCLGGGFSDLATSEDSTTAFTSEAACVSYAADGGTLAAVADPVDPRFTYFYLNTFGSEDLCIANVDVEGLAPSTTYSFTATLSDGTSIKSTRTTNAAGEASPHFTVDTDAAVTMTVQTYDATGAVPIGSPSAEYYIGPNCGGRR